MTQSPYDAVAVRYAEQFRDSLRDRPLERALLGAFAELVRAGDAGEVLDLGCGPGYVTAHLRELGLNAFGVDASSAMIGLAREACPELRFEVGSMAALDLEDSSVVGVLARYSVIHTPPEDLPAVLAEIGRVLAPGGHLLISLFATDDPGATWQDYDHTVTTAYRWSPDHFAGLLREAGTAEVARTLCEPLPTDRRQFQELQLLARKG
ncbi:SAM-dependent methyltransferase [Streptacidiphilus pinicola]|uniref:SAM-dependent methyltransferase n=1 Tax=Streptacidiphilus pinicola TaxID=2219663 RepID=A0A2X0J1P5_9ACTN|nr:class I SAM-dependent methyltransferase [Streptacidiphilus pinicola]RAG84116.1 SAM-dependent methyltransferase [Streptacidiphilus pinicola]